MSAADLGSGIQTLLKRLQKSRSEALAPEAGACPLVLDEAEPVLAEFVYAFLVWEAGSTKAAPAARRLESAVVDFNELRVCLANEVAELLGARYPRQEERALRLRAALNGIYAREHAVTLSPLAEMPKREARQYLESLEGVPPFVAARVTLLALGGHAAPVDDRIAKVLRKTKLFEDGATPESLAGALERAVRAGELEPCYRLLQAEADAGRSTAASGAGAGGGASGEAGAGSTARKTSRKSGAASRRGSGATKK